MTEETKTLKQLLLILKEVTPELDNIAARILKDHPELVAHNSSKGVGILLGRVIGIATMDFLCYAFDKPELGYHPTYFQN